MGSLNCALFLTLLCKVSLPGGTWDMVLEFGEPVQVTASIGGNPVKDTVPETILRILHREEITQKRPSLQCPC